MITNPTQPGASQPTPIYWETNLTLDATPENVMEGDSDLYTVLIALFFHQRHLLEETQSTLTHYMEKATIPLNVQVTGNFRRIYHLSENMHTLIDALQSRLAELQRQKGGTAA